jgi:hypothetical protein
MNDLDLLREFRSAVQTPDEGSVRTARLGMFGEPPRRKRPVRARRWAVPVGIAAAAVAIAVAVPSVLPGGHSGGAKRAAADVLLEQAQVAARRDQEQPAPGPGQYVYTKTRGDFLNVWADAGPNHEGFTVEMPETREAWIAPDGSGRLLETTGTPSFPTAHDREVWVAAGSPDLGGNQTHDDAFPAAAPDKGGLYYMDLAGLPTDADQLKKLIEERKVEGGPPGDGETFTIIGDMLRETYAPPKLRAALYEIVSQLPGVEYVGHVTDDAGRDGIAVAFPNEHGGVRQELVFDPNTSELLAERFVLTEDAAEGPAGTVLDSATYLASGIVDSTSKRATE